MILNPASALQSVKWGGETVSFRLREDASSCQKPTFYAAVREPAIGAKADILHLISNGPKMESGQRVERRLCEGY